MMFISEACRMAVACGASILLTMSRVFILRSAMAHVRHTEVDTRRLRTREMMAQNVDSQNSKAVSALRFSEPLALANSARADVVGSHSIIKFYSNCETSGNTQHGIVRKCSQIGVGISRAFGVLFKRKAGATLGKSGFSPVVNFRICREFLQEFISNGFSYSKWSNMGNMSNMPHLLADAHNNYNGTYRNITTIITNTTNTTSGISINGGVIC